MVSQRWLAAWRCQDATSDVATGQPGFSSHTHGCGWPMTGTSDRGRHRLAVMNRHASARKTSQRGLQFNTISRLILFFIIIIVIMIASRASL